jgi:predicted DNA-binding protein (MmcQ/YjbR family)
MVGSLRSWEVDSQARVYLGVELAAAVSTSLSSAALPGTMGAVNRDALRDLCLTFQGSEETFPFGFETSVFKVAGKMFALSRLEGEPLSVSLKCEPMLAEQLRAAHACITAGYHLNKRHWNTVLLDGTLSEQMVADLVEDSYDLVVSKLSRARQRALLWRGAE